ncbi:hypothetical protein MMC20_003235 [Loxospora ochrophaea]|nr:hypothetical protein [Loxospora ochrophaea]
MAYELQDYDPPDAYQNLDEVAGPSPVDNPREQTFYRPESLELTRGEEDDDEPSYIHHDLESQQTRPSQRRREESEGENAELTELAVPPPLDREERTHQRKRKPSSTQDSPPSWSPQKPQHSQARERVSRISTQVYTISHLVLFSILGTLARLGLEALTFYPGAPAVTSVLWANVGGSVFMGFLSEDRKVFREEWGNWSSSVEASDSESSRLAAQKKHGTVKKTIPLYIGLATGFCGSFTSFSSFIRDVYFALSNTLPTSVSHPSTQPVSSSSTISRNAGYSFLATLAVIILTVCLCLSALQFGAHLAIALEPFTPTIPFRFMRRFIDPTLVFLAWGCWLGAILMSIWPPDRAGGPEVRTPETWRGHALFALCLAPLGTLTRFYASIHLNGKIASFPLGTFAVNMLGTALLGLFYDLQHIRLGNDATVGGGMIGCQLFQGAMDGFCGCLTTVSTWVSEIKGLRRKHGYIYGLISVLLGLGLLVIIIGSLQWSVGFEPAACVTIVS